jgi:hypothetical protein
MANDASTTSTTSSNGNSVSQLSEVELQRALDLLAKDEARATARAARKAQRDAQGPQANATHVLLQTIADVMVDGIGIEDADTMRDMFGRVADLVGAAAESDNLTQSATFKTTNLQIKRTASRFVGK